MRSEDKKRARYCEESGMTLTEVVVSMIVLVVVLAGMGQALTLAIRMNTDSKTGISGLSLGKRIAESSKSQIQVSQSSFDGATTNNALNRAYYVDADGNELTGAQAASGAAFEATVLVIDWKDSSGNTLSATDSSGVSHVLLKVLSLTLHPRQNAVSSKAGTSRDFTLLVEIARPAA